MALQVLHVGRGGGHLHLALFRCCRTILSLGINLSLGKLGDAVGKVLGAFDLATQVVTAIDNIANPGETTLEGAVVLHLSAYVGLSMS